MSVKLYKAVHKIINKNGASIWIPANIVSPNFARLSIPDVYAEDTTQQYPLSTKLEFADGRVFRYCKAKAAIGYTARLVANGWASAVGDVDGFNGYVYSTLTAGDDHVHIADTTTRVENYYEGGFFGYSAAGGQYVTHRIAGSDVAAAADDYVTLWLDDPVRAGLAVTSRETRTQPCIYGAIIGGLTSQQWKSFVCVNQVPITGAYWFWGQTKGPCNLVNYGEGAAECGGTINIRDVYGMVTDGSICDNTSTPTGYQRVGYVLPITSAAVGEIFIMLQLE